MTSLFFLVNTVVPPVIGFGIGTIFGESRILLTKYNDQQLDYFNLQSILLTGTGIITFVIGTRLILSSLIKLWPQNGKKERTNICWYITGLGSSLVGSFLVGRYSTLLLGQLGIGLIKMLLS